MVRVSMGNDDKIDIVRGDGDIGKCFMNMLEKMIMARINKYIFIPGYKI